MIEYPADPPVDQRWNRRRLRSNNEWLLLERLRTAGPASRAQLARDSGLSKPTVSAALAALEQAGLAREAGTVVPDRGRTAVLYEVDPTAGYVLGVDIGRAWLRLAVADLAGTVVAREDVPNRGRSGSAVAEAVLAAAERVTAAAGLGRGDIVEAVVGAPGVFDEQTGRVRYAVNLPGWGRSGLVAGMREGLATSLTLHNDANLAAIGEYACGAGAGSRLFVYILIGTGLGMGVVADGELFRGAHGAAGEIGFLPLLTNPMPPSAPSPVEGAPRRGSLEDAVSGEAVVRGARMLGMSGPLSAKQVFEAAREGVPAAVAAVRQEGERLAHVVAAVSSVLDPDLVVLGGGVGHSADLLQQTVEDTLHRLTPLRPRVTPSSLGDDAVLLGAITTALRSARPKVFDTLTAPPQT
ncbi:ROK family transcriptional regulator [Streptacidiphilus carbonis]|uniref:ROK family transcriptional regulator n=1 Tax=Streptacidiphilus carbonis TaxID=105422 RepID=UPI0005AB913D|nr:ROK family transcriptional regulator [Streptacidiphilus carbonis]